MTAQIIQFVPRPNPNRTAVTLEQQAIGIVDYINGLQGIPYVETTGYTETALYNGAGIDGMDVTQANAFHGPAKDPA